MGKGTSAAIGGGVGGVAGGVVGALIGGKKRRMMGAAIGAVAGAAGGAGVGYAVGKDDVAPTPGPPAQLPPVQTKCDPGYILVNGVCVPDPKQNPIGKKTPIKMGPPVQKTCPAGTVLVGPDCVPVGVPQITPVIPSGLPGDFNPFQVVQTDPGASTLHGFYGAARRPRRY